MMIRQGDVLLKLVAAPAGKLQRVCDAQGPLQGLEIEGEQTGHAHRLAARVYDTAAGDRLLFVPRPTDITHEEHADIEVPAGWWRPVQQREYVGAAVRSRALVD